MRLSPFPALVVAVVACRPAAPPEKFETAKVDRGRIVARVTASGTLSALVTVQVGAQVSGTIQQLFVDFNSPVHRGQVLAKIDDRLFRAALDQARANVLAAEGTLANARAQAKNDRLQLARDERLLARNLIAQSDLDTARAAAEGAAGQVEASEGALAQARANLSQAEVNLKYTTIVSPIAGVVIARNVDVGQTVASAFQTPTLFLIAEDLKRMQVDTSVAESDVGHVREGMDASFTVDAYPNEAFRGRVRQVRYNPQTVQSVVTYDAVLDVANDALKLRPGMTANVTFVYADRPEVLRIANAALRARPPPAPGASLRPRSTAPADRRTVWILGKDGKARPVEIRTGVSDGNLTEVVAVDLQAGDRAITEFLAGVGAKGPHPPRFF